jgi:hypothetical protein
MRLFQHQDPVHFEGLLSMADLVDKDAARSGAG